MGLTETTSLEFPKWRRREIEDRKIGCVKGGLAPGPLFIQPRCAFGELQKRQDYESRWVLRKEVGRVSKFFGRIYDVVLHVGKWRL